MDFQNVSVDWLWSIPFLRLHVRDNECHDRRLATRDKIHYRLLRFNSLRHPGVHRTGVSTKNLEYIKMIKRNLLDSHIRPMLPGLPLLVRYKGLEHVNCQRILLILIKMVVLSLYLAIGRSPDEVILTYPNLFFYFCRIFRRIIKATSSVLMTLDDVIVHMRKFVIALFTVYRCLGLAYPYNYGLFHKSSPSV